MEVHPQKREGCVNKGKQGAVGDSKAVGQSDGEAHKKLSSKQKRAVGANNKESEVKKEAKCK